MHDTRTLWNSRYAHQGEQQLTRAADPWLARWLERIAPAREGMALDLGCGEGRTCQYLAENGFRHLTALDLSDEALRICQRHVPRVTPLQHDIRTPLPFPDGYFHLVIASLSLHYYPWSITLAIVREIARCVPMGGMLFARLNSLHDLNFGAVGHPEIEPHLLLVNGELKRFFDQASIEELFADGWTVQALEEMTITTRTAPKVLWEVVLQRDR
jgi:SAM-dependent methyltransferase